MKSRISFFNWATVKKDITRFIPLWALYTVVLLIFMLPEVSGGYYHPALELNSLIMVMGFFSLIYGMLTAQLLFGELFNSRLCNGLHALPVTRLARFCSHLISGLAFSFVPNFLICLLMMPSLEEFWYTALLWMVAVDMQYVFFFAVGVLSVMCSGSRFAAVLVYGILNFFAYIAYWFVSVVFIPMMPGVVLNNELFVHFCPAVKLIAMNYYIKIDWYNCEYTGPFFGGLGESWGYLGIVFAIAVGLLVFSFLLYRRRKLECAGEFVVVKWFKPIFLVLYTLSAGALLSLFGSLFSLFYNDYGELIMLIPGLIIGFFTGKMLMERTIRVFKKWNFLQAGIFAVAILLCVGAVKMDLLGIVRYVPDLEDIEYIKVDRSNAWNQKLYLDEDKQDVLDIHNLLVGTDCDRECGNAHFYFHVEYHMKDGSTIIREYSNVCRGTQVARMINSLPNGK